MIPLLDNKHYDRSSVFAPDGLSRVGFDLECGGRRTPVLYQGSWRRRFG